MEVNGLFIMVGGALLLMILLAFFGMTISIHYSNRATIANLQEQLETSRALVDSWHRKEMRQVKLQLWEKRLEVYFLCEEAILNILEPNGKPMELLKRKELDRRVKYLFGSDVRRYVAELLDNCDEYYVKKRKPVGTLEVDNQYTKLTRYLKKQLQEGLNEAFYPYLNFSDQIR